MCEASKLARPPRLERGTLCLEGRCSIQLSYGRTKVGLLDGVPLETASAKRK